MEQSNCMVDGDPNAPIMLIGMAPGKEELERDKPFVGGAGALLWAIARGAGITRADCYIVNVIGEWPDKKNGTPTAEQIARYRDQFEAAVGAFRGRIAVPLGGDALAAATGLKGIESWRGYLVKRDECVAAEVTTFTQGTYKTGNKKLGRRAGDPRQLKVKVLKGTPIWEGIEWIMPCLHPAGVLRSGRKTLPAFNADIERIARAWRGELRQGMEFVEVREGMMATGDGPFLIDVETSPYLRIGMAGRVDEKKVVAYTTPLTAISRGFTNREMNKGGRTFVAHNAQFDLAVMAEHGMEWNGPVFDTMMAAALLQPDLYKGLNEVASLYLDRARWKHKAADDDVEYNLTDVKVEYELFEILRQELKDDNMLGLFENNIMPGLRALTKMTKRGVPIHRERRDIWLAELTATVEEDRKLWSAMTNGVPAGSPAKVAALLYDTLKFPVKRKKDGARTAEKAALMELLNDLKEGDPREPILQKLIEIRKNEKLLTGYARKPIGDDDKVHPYYLPITKDSDDEDTGKGLAGTGRIQARQPNIQQLPPKARYIVIPSSPDKVLVSFDFKQLELRISCALSGDKVLERDLELGIFERVMEKLGCDRTRAKNVVYGTLYGGGPGAIQKALRTKGVHVKKAECEKMQALFAATYPDLWAWRNNAAATAKAMSFIVNPYGRRRYFYNGGSDGPAAMDFLPQGTAADVVWSDLDPLETATQQAGGALFATVHDEFVCELPRLGLDGAIRTCLGVLERFRPELGVSLPVGVKVGDDWANVTEWKPAA